MDNKYISFRSEPDIDEKLNEMIGVLNTRSLKDGVEYNRTDVLKMAIDYYYFEVMNQNNTGIVNDIIMNAINTYLRSQVRVDNDFKNGMLTEVIINQEILKILLSSNDIKYEDLIDTIQNNINERILYNEENG